MMLFPFWYLVTLALDLLGKVANSFQTKVNLSSAALYLKLVGVGLMLAQIAGYKPFTLIWLPLMIENVINDELVLLLKSLWEAEIEYLDAVVLLY